jgi:hypothetical protein
VIIVRARAVWMRVGTLAVALVSTLLGSTIIVRAGAVWMRVGTLAVALVSYLLAVIIARLSMIPKL